MSAVAHTPESASLETALRELQQGIAGQLPADMHARLSTAIEDLVRSNPGIHALQAGQRAPEFALPDLNGRTVSLSDQLRDGPVILNFYRGSWCPYCDLTLRAYSKMVPQLRRAGAKLIAVSPQSAQAAAPNAAEHRELGFPLLSDAGNRVAQQYGLVYSASNLMRSLLVDFGLDLPSINASGNWQLPVPATYLVTPDAQIRWAHVDADYRVRAEPEHILQALTKL